MTYRLLLALLLLSCGEGWASESDLPLTYIIPNNDVVSIEMVPIVAVSAQDQDGMYHTIKVDKDGYVLLSPCHERMKEAMRKMKSQVHPNPNSRSLVRGFVITEEIWSRELEPLYQDCVQERGR